jgi:hypothetical protein
VYFIADKYLIHAAVLKMSQHVTLKRFTFTFTRVLLEECWCYDFNVQCGSNMTGTDCV